MGEFSPTTRNGDCEEIANPSTAYGRRRRGKASDSIFLLMHDLHFTSSEPHPQCSERREDTPLRKRLFIIARLWCASSIRSTGTKVP
jgi:hypothetical protein